MKKLWVYKFIIIMFVTASLMLFWDIAPNKFPDAKPKASGQVKQTVTILPFSESEPEPEPTKPTAGDGFFFIIPIPIVEEGVISEEEFFPEEEIIPEEEMPPEEKEIPYEKIIEVLEIPEISEIQFEVELNIRDVNKKIFPGDNLVAQCEIIKFELKERTDIPFHYQIKDYNNEIVLDYTEIMSIEDRSSFVKSFYIIEEAELGKYSIFLEVPYGDFFTSSSDTFEIVEKVLIVAPAEAVSIAKIDFKKIGLILIIFLTISVITVWILWKILDIIYA